jgi:hypothetical protein
VPASQLTPKAQPAAARHGFATRSVERGADVRNRLELVSSPRAAFRANLSARRPGSVCSRGRTLPSEPTTQDVDFVFVHGEPCRRRRRASTTPAGARSIRGSPCRGPGGDGCTQTEPETAKFVFVHGEPCRRRTGSCSAREVLVERGDARPGRPRAGESRCSRAGAAPLAARRASRLLGELECRGSVPHRAPSRARKRLSQAEKWRRLRTPFWARKQARLPKRVRR